MDLWDNFFFVRGQSEASSALNNHKNPSYCVKSYTTNGSLILSQHMIFLLFVSSDNHRYAIKMNMEHIRSTYLIYIPQVKWREHEVLVDISN